MTFYRGRRLLVVCVAGFAVTVAAGLSGLAVDQFLAGIFGGGALTAAFIAARRRSS